MRGNATGSGCRDGEKVGEAVKQKEGRNEAPGEAKAVRYHIPLHVIYIDQLQPLLTCFHSTSPLIHATPCVHVR